MLGLMIAPFVTASPAISITEAYDVAIWFLRQVGEANVTVKVAWYDEHGYAGPRGIPAYEVQAIGGRRREFTVFIDSISGDVVSAYAVGIAPGTVSDRSLSHAEKLLIALGRRADFGRPIADKWNRFESLVAGKPVFNRAGRSFATYGEESNGRFTNFENAGEPPPAPRARASVQESQVATRVPHIVGRPELGVFYDDSAHESRWAWRAKTASGVVLLDALSGAVIPSQRVQTSAFNYHPRAPRVGLRGIPMQPVPILDLASNTLAAIGRSDLRFDCVWLEDNLRAHFFDRSSARFDKSGRLINFSSAVGWEPCDATRSRCVEQAKKIARFLAVKLPEGDFETEKQGLVGNVYFVQRAMGYPYLDMPRLWIQFGKGGRLNSINNYPPVAGKEAPTRTPHPKPQTEILREAKALADRYVPTSRRIASGAQFTRTVHVKRLGWIRDRSAHRTRLVYEVLIVFVNPSQRMGTTPGGVYHFDAETGKCIDWDTREYRLVS